jgi:MoaA/NifB/PqqE/SkfB family radical SAM enzyme
LMMPFALDVLAAAGDAGLTTGVVTNGILIDDAVARRLAALRVRNVSISLNSMDPKIHNKLRGGFKQVMAAIDRVIAAGVTTLQINAVIAQPNLADVERIGRFALERKVHVSFMPLAVPDDASDFGSMSLKALPIARRRELYTELGPICRETNNLPFLRFFRALYCEDVPQKPRQCWGHHARMSNLVVDHNGDVFPCFHRKDLRAGNLINEDPDAVFARARVMRDRVAGAPCFGEHCVGLNIS